MAEIRCKVCESGNLVQRKVHRMSGPAVTIGYILLIPSLLGLVASLGFLILGWTAAAGVANTISDPTVQTLQQANVPEELVQQLKEGRIVSREQIASVPDAQKQAIETANMELAGSLAGAGCAGACSTGLAGVGAVLSFVGGLVGWLLVMKKTVLACTNCGATVAAS